MTGKIHDLLYAWSGTPVNAPVTAIDPPKGALVIDTTNGTLYQKTGAPGSNASYSLVTAVAQ